MTLFGTSILIEVTNYYLIANSIPRLWLFHFFTLLEYALLIFAFSYWHNFRVKKILRWSILVFAIIWFMAKLSLEKFSEWDSYTVSLESVILISVSAYTLFNMGKRSDSLFREPQFWISGAVLIYFAGNLWNFALGNIILSWYNQNINVTWPIHSILNITCNISYAGAFLCLRQHPKYGGLLSSVA